MQSSAMWCSAVPDKKRGRVTAEGGSPELVLHLADRGTAG